MATNPFTGMGWGNTPADSNVGSSVIGNTLFSPTQQPNNPLLGWAGQNVNQNSSSSNTPTFTAPSIVGGMNNPGGLPELPTNWKDAQRAAAYLNALIGAEREQMAPAFANEMFSLAGPAANVFTNYANLGSPFYQQKQAALFGQGVQQNQNAAAQAQQQLASRGYGYGPSGTNAAMIGGMNMAGGANLVQNYLNSLFQNEQLQMTAAQNLGTLANMFNPAPLMGQISSQSTQGPTFASQFKDFAQGISSLAGAATGINTGFFGGPQANACWIARAVYGQDSAIAERIRQRLGTLAASKPVYAALMTAYRAVGEKVAEKVKRVPALRNAFRWLFNQFLADEDKWPIGTFFELLCVEGINAC